MIYFIDISDVKRHIVTDGDVVGDVIDNVKQRFSSIKNARITSKDIDSVTYDPRGIVFRPRSELLFFLDDRKLFCPLSNWPEFLSNCLDSFKREDTEQRYGGSFYKLHGQNTIIVLSKKQKNNLMFQIRNRRSEINQIYQDFFESTVGNMNVNP